MQENNNLREDNSNSTKYTTESEIDRVFSVFQSFNKNPEIQKHPSDNQDEKVLTMSSLGQLGRFGNQLFQYAFLKISAENRKAKVECPSWIGQSLFGHDDQPITRRLPPAIECAENENTLFDIIPEFIPYLEKSAKAKSCRIDYDFLTSESIGVDLWGFFQFHSHIFKPYQEYFRSLFKPVDELQIPLRHSLNILQSKGKTVVGIHIRRGDYITEPRAGFTLVFPTRWYCQWLESIWKELEEPVLFICSDDLDNVLPEFAKFSPVTTKDLQVQLPSSFKELNIEFYSDFFLLSHCDVVCISNSIFSFAASMLNEKCKSFVRPTWDFDKKFTSFDPWDSKPILWLGDENPKFFKNFIDILTITYTTQGLLTMIKSLIVYIPLSIIKGWVIRFYLGYKVHGYLGLCRSLLYTLGFKFAWRNFGEHLN
ncbi:alpha-1,2-fucosyltransferase [Pseudanabaena sp. FACHB-1998]|uniref:alpha-1,2-fucosyltransferase n=1 Tax=Pseudanabaena sp. FACHB-1998 TaxID=2692858 RepID=UPI0016817D25|nr:alpha-1,2-fucosyltransferase [Pseudanabaena sp. FACHB-1998]MBD2177888.1 alpha-1,2-fucosyltransferase [Pseudanabaena sp. FACHB-1998]